MHVLVLASQKGGSGKTTLSGHLAVEAEHAGVGLVALIDTDPQGSLAQRWNARTADAPVFAQAALADLGATLAELQRSGVRLAVIDTPPAITDSISQVVAHADLVVVLTRGCRRTTTCARVGATVDIARGCSGQAAGLRPQRYHGARATPAMAAVALSRHWHESCRECTLYRSSPISAGSMVGLAHGRARRQTQDRARRGAELLALCAGSVCRG